MEVFILMSLLACAFGAPANNTKEVARASTPINPSNLTEVVNYLSRFGYLGQSNPDHTMMRNALLKYQEMAGIQQTGILDEQTADMMKRPRCGVPDVSIDRDGRYVLQGDQWAKTVLTYKAQSYSSDLSQSDIDNVLQASLYAWADVSALYFTPSDTADVVYEFFTGDHGDGKPFDGPGNVLAHAYYPLTAREGEIHMDDDETWVLSPASNSFVLLGTTIHEIGHTIGLKHSSDSGAIMYAYENGVTALTQDDIDGAQAIYGGTVDPVFNTDNGGFVSRNYPNNYPNYHDFVWKIESGGKAVFITFDTFDVESHSSCIWDWVTVYETDGTNLVGTSSGKLCGGPYGPMSGNSETGEGLDVTFHTDYSVTKKGFKVSYYRG